MVGKLHCLRVWGDFACFTRPEARVERLSYPVITPSAARAIFEAIYWKPQDWYWQIARVEILREPRFISLRRNETKSKSDPEQTVLRWASGRAEPRPLLADVFKGGLGTEIRGRTQRQTVALRDVAYRLYARMISRKQRSLPLQDAQFERRARAGKCFQQPYFGCREFPCYFELATDCGAEPPFPLDLDLGLMLYDVFPIAESQTAPCVSLFHARVLGGVLEVPEYESDRVLKGITL